MPNRPSDVVLAPSVRRPVAGLVAVATAAALGLAVGVAGVRGPGRLDELVDPLVRRGAAPIADELWWVIRLIGPAGVVVAGCLFAAACLVGRRRRLAVVALAGPLLTGIATSVSKPLVGRTLDGYLALPSGHTGGATAVATVAAIAVVHQTGGRRVVAVSALLGICAVGATMAVALVANGLHYTTDTVAGFCTALAVVLGTALAVDASAVRRTAARGPDVSGG